MVKARPKDPTYFMIDKKQLSEEDIKLQFITPALNCAGWDNQHIRMDCTKFRRLNHEAWFMVVFQYVVCYFANCLWWREKTVIQKITVFLCIMKNRVGSYSQMLMKKMLFFL